MKKSFFIWAAIVLLAISILGEAYVLFLTSAPIYEYVMNIITIIIYSVLLVKLFKLHKDVVRWIHAAFIWTGIGMIYNIINTIDAQGSMQAMLITNILFWAIFIVLWVYFTKHVKKVLSSRLSN
ncbi:MAG: hypothetical protein QG640_655 [Patescibacteria group bacterium]|nr:hypothetical protein [Patescibacteria group bacterium]